MDIGAFIADSNTISNVTRLNELMTQAIRAYGYEKLVYFTELGLDGSDEEQQEFIASYNQRKLKAADPVLHLFFTHNMPFTHKQIVFDALAPEQRNVMELHRNCCGSAGISFPVGNVCKRWVGITLGGSDDNAPREDGLAISQLYALVNQYALRYAQIMHEHPQTTRQMQQQLS